jgi:hypothetical protein
VFCCLDVEGYAAAGRNIVVPRLPCPTSRRPLIFWWGLPALRAPVGDVAHLGAPGEVPPLRGL